MYIYIYVCVYNCNQRPYCYEMHMLCSRQVIIEGGGSNHTSVTGIDRAVCASRLEQRGTVRVVPLKVREVLVVFFGSDSDQDAWNIDDGSVHATSVEYMLRCG